MKVHRYTSTGRVSRVPIVNGEMQDSVYQGGSVEGGLRVNMRFHLSDGSIVHVSRAEYETMRKWFERL